MSLHPLFAGILSAHTGAGYAEDDEPESALDDEAQYAIKVIERRIESLTTSHESIKIDPETDWYSRGLKAGLMIALAALKDEIRFVKLERGPIILTKDGN